MAKKDEAVEEKNEVAVQEEAVLSFAAFKNQEGLEVIGLDVNSSDMKLPKVKLLQSTSPEVTKCKDGSLKAGMFYNTIEQKGYDSIDCVILDQGKSMVYWKQPFKRGDDPLCRSFDGKVKVEGCGDGNCLKCQYSSQNPAAWKVCKDNGESKPACNMSYVFLAIDNATKMPFRIIVAGASVTSGKDFLNKLIPLNVAPFACKVTLTSKQMENDQGVFYIVEFKNFRPNDDLIVEGGIDKEKYNALADMSLAYKSLFMTQIVAGDVVDSDAAEATEAGGLF